MTNGDVETQVFLNTIKNLFLESMINMYKHVELSFHTLKKQISHTVVNKSHTIISIEHVFNLFFPIYIGNTK